MEEEEEETNLQKDTTIDLSKEPEEILNDLAKDRTFYGDKCSISYLKMNNTLSDKMVDMENHVVQEQDDDYELDI